MNLAWMYQVLLKRLLLLLLLAWQNWVHSTLLILSA